MAFVRAFVVVGLIWFLSLQMIRSDQSMEWALRDTLIQVMNQALSLLLVTGYLFAAYLVWIILRAQARSRR